MSTLQHTIQPVLRTRIAFVVLAVAAVAALTVVLIVSAGSSNSVGSQPQPTKAELQRQLQSVSGARYELKPPTPTPAAGTRISPQRQLEAVAGARYHQQASWVNRQR
jgi:hypothetical protein